MFPCPLCGTYLTEPELVKRNVKYMGSTEVEYDARCPRCSEMIGHVSWGQFIPLEPHTPRERTPEPEVVEDRRKKTRVCPHCGLPWPEEEPE